MIIYEPSTFTITTEMGEKVLIRNSIMTVGEERIPILSLLQMKPTFNHSTLLSLLANLEYVFKGNVQIPLEILDKRWAKILTSQYNAQALPKNIIIGNNQRGAYVEIVSKESPLDLYMWSIPQSTFIPYEGEINYDRVSFKTIVSRGLQPI